MVFIFFLCLLISVVRATVRNVTIDDLFGDTETKEIPVYLPEGGWTLKGAECSGCAFHPDPNSANAGTWHDTTHHTYDLPKTVQFNFSGFALTVYCIVPNAAVPYITSLYDLQFFIDGNAVGSYNHPSDSSGRFNYKVPVFTVGNLTNSTHFFSMTAASTTVNSTILFDYAVYTLEEADPVTSTPSSFPSTTPSPSPSPPVDQSLGANDSGSRNNLGPILGGIFGGLAVVAVVLAAICLIRKRRRRTHLHPLNAAGFDLASTIQPFVATNSPQAPSKPVPPAPMFYKETSSQSSLVTSSASPLQPKRHKRDLSDPSLARSTSPSSHSAGSFSGPEVSHLRQQVADLRSQYQAMVAETSGSARQTPLQGYRF